MTELTKWIAGVAFLMVVSVSGAQAQATRTWVSGVGDDANPCSRTAPCKTFAGAISKTAANGEINVLDSGGFGAVTITKAITIDGSGGSIAGILASSVNGVIVNAGVNDVVILRNLDINGVGASPGGSGIRFLAGKALFVESSTISRFPNFGIEFIPSGVARLFVDRTLIRQAVAGGLLIKPGALGSALATIANSRFENSLYGVRAEDRSAAIISNSVASGNTNSGFSVFTSAAAADMNLESCVATYNGFGIASNGAVAMVRISNVFVTHNTEGLKSVNGGDIESFLNNRIVGNSVNGAPTAATAQQ